ncbi:MAG TPA: hypothetical protein VNK04_06240 [Gemmataceae bacterium]|nr:hypothetical protein [Gemmataceae bacterium]
MRQRFCLSRTALLLLAAAALILVGPLAAAQAENFQVSGTYVFTDLQGAATAGTLSGQARPGGQFSGDFAQKRGGGGISGMATFNFNGGSLLIAYQVAFDDELGLLVGPYVIISGTGRWEGIGGDGVLLIEPAVNGTGGFTMSGTLSR